ncbi:MAG: DNA mismatch repair protein MutS [Acholeplasmatales bacterium]|nr:DNA mismatch repair protein MutS [Acholeplasmatales bacterium]
MGDVKYSPMIEQYLEIKNAYKDFIVFFRLGDFYELFFDDAKIGSKELELALTGKDAGQEERVPMCGVPFHAADTYIEKMVSKGYKVAIVEQIEDPKEAVGIVKRGVVKIVTPGTIDSGLDEKSNNYIASVHQNRRNYFLAYGDISTGDNYLTVFKNVNELNMELTSLNVKEVIVSSEFNNKIVFDYLKMNEIVVSYEDKVELPTSMNKYIATLEDDYKLVVSRYINYYIDTQKVIPTHFKPFIIYDSDKYLKLDAFTKKNLELTETLRLKSRVGSLLNLIDKTNTAMGSRMLRHWLEKPLVEEDKINERLDFVEILNTNYIVREDLKSSFKNVYDLERIIGRIASNSANAKDLVWLRRSLNEIPNIVNALSCLDNPSVNKLVEDINPHEELRELLNRSLVEDPPLSVKEGGLIKEGYNSQLDEIKNIANNGKNFIVDYEREQKEKTGIKTLKVGYNKIVGYFIEISKGAIKDLPPDCNYERRATLVNSERFISPELKRFEEMVIGAKEQIEGLEYELFCQIRNEASKSIDTIQELADIISTIDSYVSLSEVATKFNYVRPTFNHNREINIVDGRHPVLENLIKSDYIVNDVVINKYNMMLITGPNMSGKSTYMRMLASIVILAQIGSFVPAKVANLTIFDSIFTRIGASDDLTSFQSTFMVEMIETNYALSNATKDSLILFDEIGRGTATYDGMALARAILEYIHEKIGAITLFSTHYHELTVLEGKLKRLKNVHVEAKEQAGGITFLHKVKDGATDKSYGINVASLANLPKSLIERSKQILESLEADSSKKKNMTLDLFNFDSYEEAEEDKKDKSLLEIKKRLDEVDENRLTPIEALNLIYELKEIK